MVEGQREFGLLEGQGLEEGAEPNKAQGVNVIIWRCIHGQLEEVAMVDEPGLRDGASTSWTNAGNDEENRVQTAV